MKITLDLTSVVVGGAIALALGVVAGFSPQVSQVPPQRPSDPTGTLSVRPEPRDFVWLEAKGDARDMSSCSVMQGTAYDSPLFTVPTGKILVVTALSTGSDVDSSTCTAGGRIDIDGIQRFYRFSLSRQTISFGNGIALPEGTTVQLRAPLTPEGVLNLHGYLADA